MKKNSQNRVHQLATAYLLHAIVYAVIIGLGFYFEQLDVLNREAIAQNRDLALAGLSRQAEIYYYSCLAAAILISVAVMWFHASQSMATGNFFFFCFTAIFGFYAYILFFTWGDIRLEQSRWWIAGGCLIQIAFSCIEYIKWNKGSYGKSKSDLLDDNSLK